MKKINILAAAGLMLLSSCDLDINQDPNYPTKSDISPELQFPSVISAIADASGDQMFNYGGFFAQYFDQMPEANQYNDLAELNIDESKDIFNRCYRNIYAGALMDIEDIKSKTTNTANLFVCQVMRTQAFQLLVDNTGETPYSEALNPSNSSPKYDDGKTVYEGVLKELDEAEAALNGDVMNMTDPLLKKNMDQWKGYANALRLRMYLRLIDGGQTEYQSKATALVNADNFFTGNVAWDVFSDLEGQYNPWYQSVFRLTNNHCAAYPIVSYMQNTSDPRLDYAIKARESDGTFVGQFPGSKQEPAIVGTSYKNKDVSTINYDVFHDTPIYLFTQSELQFLIAEIQLKYGTASAAKAAYEAAVKADFASRGVSGADAFLSGNLVNWDSAADKAKLIAMQKWVALFYRNHMEAWSEIRRTDIPATSPKSGKDIFSDPTIYNAGDMIVPATNYIQAGGLCKRVPYPQNARQLNVNTPPAKLLSDRVFWDAK